MIAVDQALIRLHRESAAPKRQPVHLLRDRIEPVHRIILFRTGAGNGIDVDNALSIHHALQPRNGIKLLLRPAIGADQAQVKHILRIHIFLARGHHIRFGHQQTHEHTGAQSYDCNDCKIASQGFQNGLQQIFAHRIFLHYHSISAIFWGFSLIFTDVTVPLRTLITRSAMAVSAPLWVMMITVMPVFRPVS